MKKPKVGIVGCGAIGNEIAAACTNFLKGRVALCALYDIKKEKSSSLARRLGDSSLPVGSLEKLFEKSDLIIECASAQVAKGIVEKAIEKNKDVMILSVGALIEARSLLEKAEKKNVKVYIPSGAICGIDGLKSAKLSRIEKVILTTRKPPRGLRGAPYLEEKNIDLGSIKSETVVFEGTAYDAVRGFPRNINIASLLSIAGIGARDTKVRIVTSPEYTKNVHEVKITGDFGEITVRTENVPSRTNPKTSKLAYLSAIAMLKNITESVRVGT